MALPRAAGLPWPSVAGLCKKCGFRNGWPKIRSPWADRPGCLALSWRLREGRGLAHGHTVRLGPGLSDKRARDRFSRKGQDRGQVEV